MASNVHAATKNRKLTADRVKLPKSFLAVNLSESHTFHKKEESSENAENADSRATIAEVEASAEESKSAVPEDTPPQAS